MTYNIFMYRIPRFVLILVLCAGCATGGKERAGVELQQTAKENGIFVREVKGGSAAEKAGLQAGDVIVSYEGKSISDPGFVDRDVEVAPVGKKVQMTILRAGKPVLLEMAIEKRRSRVVNVSPPGETPDYSIRADDILWIGSYPYPVVMSDVQEQLSLLPTAIQNQDQIPYTPATLFTIPVK